MTTVKTEIGVHKRQAHHTRFAPTANISSTDVQRAVEEVSAAASPADAAYYVASANPGLPNGIVIPAFMQSLLDDTSESAARETLGVEIGVDVQSFDSGLASIAGLTTAADRMIYTTDLDVYAVTTLTAFARSILDDADEATFKATVNLETGVDVQAYSSNLDSWSSQSPSSYALLATLASTANSNGASLIGIEDVGALITATTVEGALAELAAASGGSGISDGAILAVGLTFPNTGLHLLDTNASHDLIIAPGSDLSADRTLTLTTGDADRTLTIGADSSISGTAYVSGGTDVAVADGGTGASTAADAFNALKQTATETATGVVEMATDAEIRASSAGALAITAEDLSTAAALQALTDGATIAVDWAAGINRSVTLTDNRTLGNPTNVIAGQTRTIVAVGNSGTARSLAFGANYVGAATLTGITSSRRAFIVLFAETATRIWVSYRYQDDT